MRTRRAFFLLAVVMALVLAGCSQPQPAAAPQTGATQAPAATAVPPTATAAPPTPVPPTATPKPLSGNLTIFHAGSLAAPLRQMTEEFQALHPGVTFATESSGSTDAARKISDLGREADLMMSADLGVIEKVLMPDFATWSIQFARNTMVICYTDQSQYADEITADNWYDILTRDGVIYGHSDPNSDPCGYRTLMVWQLAESYYQVAGLNDKLVAHCPEANVRPKSVELIALLQSGDMDYAFEYRSVAVQNGLKFVELPDEVNLSQVDLADQYATAKVEVTGTEPGTTMTQVGSPIVYGLTIPTNAPNPELAAAFAAFVIGPEGQAIMEAQGQPAIAPAMTADKSLLPAVLQPLVE